MLFANQNIQLFCKRFQTITSDSKLIGEDLNTFSKTLFKDPEARLNSHNDYAVSRKYEYNVWGGGDVLFSSSTSVR